MENRKSGDLSRLRIPRGERKIQVICECGARFEAWDLGPFTRRYCDKCSAQRVTEEEELQRKAEAAETEARHLQLVGRARIPPYWREVTFDNSDPTLNKKAFRQALTYAKNFNPQTSGSLILWSRGNGTGKTRLAACIANYVLHELRQPVVFKKARDLLLEIRRTFSDRGELSEVDILNSVLSVELLVLDDVGLDSPSEWVWATYWTIFDRRLEWGLPVVLTVARYPLEATGGEISLADRVGPGALSRLRQLCQGDFIDLSGPDLR